jgi:hypothetical protein
MTTLAVDAQFDVQFSPRLAEAVNRGSLSYLVVEFDDFACHAW